MNETQVEESQEEATSVEEVTQEEEKSPMDLLLDEIDAMKSRIEQLEAAMASHGHSVNLGNEFLDQVSNLAMQKINALIRTRLGRV